MKHLINNLFAIAVLLFIASSAINAQHHMNHADKDSTKKMHHSMMNDSSKMHMEMDSSKMHHQNMNHDMMHGNKEQMNGSKEIWNSHCPIREGEVDPDTPTVEYEGKTIGFCCPGCDKKFMKNPDKYLEKFTEDGKLKN